MFIGLMGVDNDGKTLYTPSGKKLFKVPRFLAWKIQRIQHYIAKKTWR
jgi:ribosomal protein L24E